MGWLQNYQHARVSALNFGVLLQSGGVNPLGELANILQANESIADKGEGVTLRLGSDDLENGFEEES